jgi:putative protein-disulfide isomerase
MKYLIACLILLGTNTMSAQERPEIIYVFDPLCGWCYGFSPVIKQAYDTYKDKADFKVITGGMIIGDQISPIGKMAEFLKGATARVTERTGAEFSTLFLDTILTEGTQLLSSMEPSIAVQICKAEKPERIFDFMTELHKDIYISGLKTAIPTDYARLAKKMGLDENKFINNLSENKFKHMAMQDFQEAGALGVDSYPAVLIRNKQGVRVISRGYVDWDDFSKILFLEFQQ